MIGATAIGVPGSEVRFVRSDQNQRCGDHGREHKTSAHEGAVYTKGTASDFDEPGLLSPQKCPEIGWLSPLAAAIYWR
jgi:hypothetical protein